MRVSNTHERVGVVLRGCREIPYFKVDSEKPLSGGSSEKYQFIETTGSREKAAKCALKFLSLWRRSLGDGLFVPVRSAGPQGSEVVRAEFSRSELAGAGGDRVRLDEPGLHRGKDNMSRTITPPVHDGAIQDICEALRDLLFELGDDVQEKPAKQYIGFWRQRRFASVVIRKQKIKMDLYVDPSTIELKSGFSYRASRSASSRRPCVTVTIRSHEDLRRAEPLLKKSYDAAG